MSRLTEKKFLDNFKAIKNISPNFVASKEELMYEKLGKLEDLEEQIGCPLEVVFKALKNGIYVEEGTFEKYDVRGIELRGLSVISKICSYGECDFTCYYTDYKKIWWLKEDKSE